MTGLRGVLRGDKLMSREGSMGEESSGQRRGCSKRRIHLPCILPSVSSHADFTFLVDVVHFYIAVEAVSIGGTLRVLYISHTENTIYRPAVDGKLQHSTTTSISVFPW
jgi:hypothetical protein